MNLQATFARADPVQAQVESVGASGFPGEKAEPCQQDMKDRHEGHSLGISIGSGCRASAAGKWRARGCRAEYPAGRETIGFQLRNNRRAVMAEVARRLRANSGAS